LVHNPWKILDHLVTPGQTVADLGCGPGFFTLPLAKMVGESGTVIAADVQPEMLDKLRARAIKYQIDNTIKYHVCEGERIGITEKADFILAFYMVHEVPSPDRFFREIRGIVNPNGKLLCVEPKFHVSKSRFQEMVHKAESAGWRFQTSPKIRFSHSALFG
jgi:ubiquinone/menaquinone biosynthesis C-methylase UbiE